MKSIFINLFLIFLLISESLLAQQQDKLYKPKLIVPIGHTGDINSVSFSPDGKYALSGADDITMKLWDIETGREIKTFLGHTDEVQSVSFSPDGKYALSCSFDQTLKLWEIETEKEIRTFLGHADYIWSVSFSPDGKYALSGSRDKTIKLWEIETGKEIKTLSGHTGGVNSVCFSPDGKYALSGSGDSTLKLWDIETGKEIKTLSGHTDVVNSVCFSPDGKYALSGSWDYTLKLWEIETGEEIRTFLGHRWLVMSVSFSPDGKYALSGSWDYSLKLWDIETGEEIRSFSGHNWMVNSVSISPDGKYTLSGSCDRTLKLWDIETGEEIRAFSGYSQSCYSIEFSPDRKNLISVCDTTLKLWDIETGKEIRTFSGRTSGINSFSISPDGKYILSCSRCSYDSTLRLWEIETGEEIRTFSGHNNWVQSVSFSPDGKYALSGCIFDSTLTLWDIGSGKEVRTFIGHGKEDIISVSFSPDGKYALSGYSDNTIKLWDIATGEEIRSFSGYTAWFRFISFSSDGKYALTATDDNTLKLWDIETGKEIRTFIGHTNAIISVSFSPDGKYALSGSWDNTLKLWDIESGQEIRTFSGHTNWVNSVSFSPDGKYALSGSNDNTIKLWEIESGKELATLISVDSTEWIAVSPSGLFDASPGAEKLIYYTAGNEIIEMAQLKARYYQPGLLRIIMGYSDEKLRDVPPNDFVRLYPEVEIEPISEITPELKIKLTNRGGGIGRVSVYIDNILIVDDARNSVSDSSKNELNLIIDLMQDKFIKNYKFEHPNLIKVVTHNAEEYLSSRGDTISFTPSLKSVKGQELIAAEKTLNTYDIHLYGLFAGISDYEGREIDLKYAAKDAADFSAAVSLSSANLFGEEKTSIQLLNSEQTNPELQPTKENIKKAFENLQESLPQDIVVIYLSGHGINWGGQDGDFYYLTNDATSLSVSSLNDPYMKANAISSTELTEWINKIPARKKLLILDACNSGRAAEQLFASMKDVPASQIRALDRAQERTGFFILAGCAANQSSYESSLYGQGVLTYSLLKAIKGAALRFDAGQEYVDVEELMNYSVDEVPILALGISGIQKPFFRSPDQIKSFDIGRMDQEDKEKIIISEPKPVFISSNFLDSDELSDVLDLSEKINAQLDEITAKGRTAELFYIKAKDYPGAYQISGLYKISGDEITVDFKITKDNKNVGNKLSLKENTTDTEKLAAKIIEMVEKEIE